MGRVVNREELSEIFGYSKPTVSAWVEEGCPVVTHGSRGRSFEFDTEAVLKWLLARERSERKKETAKRASVEEDGEPITIDQAKLRHEIAKAKGAELDLAEKMGLVAPVAMVAKVVSNEIANCRARLLAIPTKVRPQIQLVVGAPEGTKRLVNEVEKLVREALTEIKTYGVEGEP
jgi:phage terminase Nu1 subunit (DNA packaging protein)